jgi:hypothetical protein
MSAKISPDAASLPAVTFRPHGHRKGSHVEAGNASGNATGNAGGSSIGLLPVGAGAGLFSKLLQSLEQVVGAAAPVAADPAQTLCGPPVPGATRPTVPMGTAANPASKAQLQSFLNNLAPNSARSTAGGVRT